MRCETAPMDFIFVTNDAIRADGAMAAQHHHEAHKSAQSISVIHHFVVTLLVVSAFVVTKTYYNHLRRQLAQCTVFIIGGGPAGLTAALIAAKNHHVKTLTIYEEMDRMTLLAKTYQVAFNQQSQQFLTSLGVDFDSIEGVLQDRIFHTRIGIYIENILNMLTKSHARVILKLGTKFTKDHVTEIENFWGRKVVIVADGSSGQVARLLGLSDEFLSTSCNAYGAVASMERTEQRPDPRAERRVHNLHFDLSAYGIEQENEDAQTRKSGFSLKLFGTFRHRHLSLAVPMADAVLVRRMKLVLDRSMMRNIFTTCYNMCKWYDESEITETWAVRHLSFSPRLFDIKLFQRIETVAYFQDVDLFVLVEGDAARCTNFNTGLDINMAMAGLQGLRSVINRVACALTDMNITDTMTSTTRNSDSLCKHYVRNGLQQEMLTMRHGQSNEFRFNF